MRFTNNTPEEEQYATVKQNQNSKTADNNTDTQRRRKQSE